MKKYILITALLCTVLTVFGQNPKNIIKLYGGLPTSNKNMSWKEEITPNEFYTGVIKTDSIVSSQEIIEAFILTFQPLQDANIMTKQMRNNSSWGSALSALNGDVKSMSNFAEAGDANSRIQNHIRTSWTVQFIDGVGINRFYYNVTIQAKEGRYKLSVIPSGISGYGLDHIQTEWSQIFKKGEVKSSWVKNYKRMKIKLEYTIDQWIKNVDKHFITNDDW